LGSFSQENESHSHYSEATKYLIKGTVS